MSISSLRQAHLIQAEAPFTASQLVHYAEMVLLRERNALGKSAKRRRAIGSSLRKHFETIRIDDRLNWKKFDYRVAALCRPEVTGKNDERLTGLEVHFFRIPLNGGQRIIREDRPRITVTLHALKRLVERSDCRSFEQARRTMTPMLRWVAHSNRNATGISERHIQTNEGFWPVSTSALSDDVIVRTFIGKDSLSRNKAESNAAVVDCCDTPPRLFRGLQEGEAVQSQDLINQVTAQIMMSLQGNIRSSSGDFDETRDQLLDDAIKERAPFD